MLSKTYFQILCVICVTGIICAQTTDSPATVTSSSPDVTSDAPAVATSDSSATVSTSPSDVPVVTTSDVTSDAPIVTTSDSSTTKSSSPPDVTSDSPAVTTSDVTTNAPAAATSDVTTDAPAVTTSESTTAHQDPDVTTDSQVVPTTDGKEVITLNCTATQMIVNIPVSLLEPGVVIAEDICFQNATDMTDNCCGLRADDSEIIKLETDLTGCGTTMEEFNDIELYSNEITTYESGPISRQYAVDIAVNCSYGRNQTVGYREYELKDFTINKDLNKDGEYDFSFDIYEDEKYKKAVEYPGKIGLNEDLYFAASVDSLGGSLDLSIQFCRATPTSKYDSDNHYEFIKDGCSDDGTNTIINILDEYYRIGVTMKTLRFVEDSDNYVYIHCDLLVCEAKRDSACRVNCSKDTQTVMKRKRRDVSGEIKTKRFTRGPLRVVRSSQNAHDFSMGVNENDAHTKQEVGNAFNPWMIAMAAMATVVMAMAAMMVVVLRKITKMSAIPDRYKDQLSRLMNEEI